MMWSSLPGLRRALSKQSGLFVAATTITSLLHTSWQSICQRTKTAYIITCSLNSFILIRCYDLYDGRRNESPEHMCNISNLFLCVILLLSFCLENLLRPSPLQRLQANPIHLIQEHRKEACLYTVRCLTVRP